VPDPVGLAVDIGQGAVERVQQFIGVPAAVRVMDGIAA
jgi:hypothetical protein